MHNWLLNGCVESITRTLNAELANKSLSHHFIIPANSKSPNKEVKNLESIQKLIHKRDHCALQNARKP